MGIEIERVTAFALRGNFRLALNSGLLDASLVEALGPDTGELILELRKRCFRLATDKLNRYKKTNRLVGLFYASGLEPYTNLTGCYPNQYAHKPPDLRRISTIIIFTFIVNNQLQFCRKFSRSIRRSWERSRPRSYMLTQVENPSAKFP